MTYSPMGDDDSVLIARGRLVQLVGQFEDGLTKVERIFKEHIPIEKRFREGLESHFWHFRHAADELGSRVVQIVEEFIRNYERFAIDPTSANLKELFHELEELKLLLQ